MNSLLGRRIGATRVHPYSKRQHQLEMAFTHIEAEFAFKVFRLELGLQEKKYCCNRTLIWPFFIYLLVPIGQCHHHIQSCKSEHDMEKAPAVSNRIFFIVPHLGATLPSISAAIVTCDSFIAFSLERKTKKEQSKRKPRKARRVTKCIALCPQVTTQMMHSTG